MRVYAIFDYTLHIRKSEHITGCILEVLAHILHLHRHTNGMHHLYGGRKKKSDKLLPPSQSPQEGTTMVTRKTHTLSDSRTRHGQQSRDTHALTQAMKARKKRRLEVPTVRSTRD